MRSSGSPRPARLHAAGLTLLGLAAAFYAIARTTGSGWLVVLASAFVGLLCVGALAPAVPLSRARVTLRLPRDATVGRPVPLELAVAGRAVGLRVRTLDPATPWLGIDAPAAGTATGRPARRGVVGRVEVEVTCAAPFGLVGWRRRERIVVDPPMEVGPEPAAPGPGRPGSDRRGGGAAVAVVRRGGDAVRTVREYAPGDPARLVHWPATARRGTLIVREPEADTAPRLVLVVDLRGPTDRAETIASAAAGAALEALRAGRRVELRTAEPAGPARGEVRTAVEVSRRLARAVAGPPDATAAPTGAEVEHVGARAGRGEDGVAGERPR